MRLLRRRSSEIVTWIMMLLDYFKILRLQKPQFSFFENNYCRDGRKKRETKERTDGKMEGQKDRRPFVEMRRHIHKKGS